MSIPHINTGTTSLYYFTSYWIINLHVNVASANGNIMATHQFKFFVLLFASLCCQLPSVCQTHAVAFLNLCSTSEKFWFLACTSQMIILITNSHNYPTVFDKLSGTTKPSKSHSLPKYDTGQGAAWLQSTHWQKSIWGVLMARVLHWRVLSLTGIVFYLVQSKVGTITVICVWSDGPPCGVELRWVVLCTDQPAMTKKNEARFGEVYDGMPMFHRDWRYWLRRLVVTEMFAVIKYFVYNENLKEKKGLY